MNKLLFCLLVLLVIVYIRYNLKYNDYYQILQTDLANFKEALLYEKNPLVITDMMYDQEDLLKTVFKYQFITASKWTYEPSMNNKYNYAKYLILYSKNENKSNVLVNIINPKYTNEKDPYKVAVKLNSKQTLIIPPKWMFHCDTELSCISVHDTFSLIHQTLANIV